MEKTERHKLNNKVLGALIGLVMSCESNAPTEYTTPLIIEGIRAAAGESDLNEDSSPDNIKRTESYLLTLIDRIHEEKFTIVPNCRTCACPCGNTSDYNMELLEERSEERKKANKDLLNRLYHLAIVMPDNVSDEDAFALYQGLAALSFDWEPEELEEIAR